MSLTKSSGFLPVKNIFESSAKNSEKTLEETLLRSLIYIKNNNGPRMDPCGTPQTILPLDDVAPLYSTNCYLLYK